MNFIYSSSVAVNNNNTQATFRTDKQAARNSIAATPRAALLHYNTGLANWKSQNGLTLWSSPGTRSWLPAMTTGFTPEQHPQLVTYTCEEGSAWALWSRSTEGVRGMVYAPPTSAWAPGTWRGRSSKLWRASRWQRRTQMVDGDSHLRAREIWIGSLVRLPRQTRNSGVYKAPSEECMQRIQTREMQKCLTAYLLEFACLPYHSSAHSSWVLKAVHRDACVYGKISIN